MDDLYEQYVVAFVEECRRQKRIPTSYDAQARSFVFNDSQGNRLRVFLDNNFRHWLQSDAEARTEQLVRFVRSISETDRNASIDPKKLQAELMPGIRSRALISLMLIDSWRQGAPADNRTEMVWTQFCGELAACIISDHRDSISLLTRSNLDFAKLSFDEAMAHAITQLRTKMEAPEFIHDPRADGLFYCGNLEDYQSSMLLLTAGKDFEFPPLDGDAVALVPARNQFFVTGSRNETALRALLRLAEDAEQQEHFCSTMLLVWSGNRWEEFLFEAGTDEAIKQHQIALRQLSSDYNRQKQHLDCLHETHNSDVYVSEFLVCREDDRPGAEFSVTTLASGAPGTLLPEANQLSFVDQIIDPRTGQAQGVREIVNVAWSDAMDIAHNLFEPVPHLFPPRHRALGFPDHSMWNTLRMRAGK